MVVDWSRATVVVKVPVSFTAAEQIQEIEVPLAFLLWDEDMRQKGIARLNRELRPGGRVSPSE